MGRAYDAPKITLEIKMGHSPGEIRSARGLISGFLKASESGDATIEKLRAYGEDEERGIDFLRDLLVFREEVEFHERDPDINFAIRRDFLRKVMHGVS